MKLRIAATATALLLAGCGSQGANQQAGNQAGNQAAGGAQPAAAATASAAGNSGGLTIQPGEWEVTMQMQAMQASGMPAGMQMPQMPPTTTRTCVTPEQVSRANASFLSGSGHRPGVDCDYSHVSLAGGRIQGTSSCTGNGMTATVTMDGSFTPTSYDIDERMEATMRGHATSSTSHLAGRRIGECTPDEARATGAVLGREGDGR